MDNCAECSKPVAGTELVTKCRICKLSYHISCAGVSKVSERFGCKRCYCQAGNAPQGRFERPVTPYGSKELPQVTVTDPGDEEDEQGGPSSRHDRPNLSFGRAPSVASHRDDILVELMRSQTAMLQKLVERDTRRQGSCASREVDPDRERVTSWVQNVPPIAAHVPSPPRSLDVTMARTSRDFIRCLEQQEGGERTAYVRQPPDLPRFGGSSKDWPAFIANYQESSTRMRISDVDNMARLRKALYGAAEKAVEGNLLHSSSLAEVLDSLRICFGDPGKVMQNLEQEIIATPKVDVNGKGLQMLTVRTRSLVNALTACGMEDQLRNQSLVNTLQEKLPFNLGLRWSDYRDEHGQPGLDGFDAFLKVILGKALGCGQNQVRLTTTVEPTEKKRVHTTIDVPQGEATPTTSKPSATESGKSPSSVRKVPCASCNGSHQVAQCAKFATLSSEDRMKLVEEKKLCYRCLRSNPHRCPRSQCGVSGCAYRHHTMLHEACAAKFGAPVTGVTGTTATAVSKDSPLFKIVPVEIRNGDYHVKTYAFVDDGSSVSLMDEELANELCCGGTPQPIHLKWTNDQSQRDETSRRISIDLVSEAGDVMTLNDIHTIRGLDLPRQSLTPETIKEVFPTGGGPDGYHRAQPRLLLGLPHARVSAPSDWRMAEDTGHMAIRTRLGWMVYGGENSAASVVGLNFRLCQAKRIEDKLDGMVKSFFDTESFGVRASPPKLSAKDDRAMTILQATTKRVGGRFETGLLWTTDHVRLPSSRTMCKNRAENLRSRMEKCSTLAAKLKEIMENYVRKGYARDVTGVLPKAPSWYLPVFPVVKPGKTRMVWDAAAKVGEKSLNSFLLSGPDFLIPLPEVLLRFRERKIAVTADVAEMFHQVMMREEDRDAQRFLWCPPFSKQVLEYRMEVMTFGAACSPTSAQYVKNKNAEEFASTHPAAVEAIQRNHYVDDWLNSFDSVEEAAVTVRDVTAIQRVAGFELRKWRTSHPGVLDLAADLDARDKCFDAPEGRVLGMVWNGKLDSLGFATRNVLALRDVVPLTKRAILRGVMSLFDPLGLAAHVVVKGKILLREVWRAGVSWDEAVPESIARQWREWCDGLLALDRLVIPRFYGILPDATWEMHTFVDASISAFAAVVYFRGRSVSGEIVSQLVMAKTRVAPMRALTVPRLELQAAVLGTRLAQTVCEASTVKVHRRIFWSDSKDVLWWVRSSHRRYHAFVAARVNEILDGSQEGEWRWVPTSLNVADDATRLSAPYDNVRWINGPEFLRQDENEWPSEVGVHEDVTGEELLGVHSVTSLPAGLVPDASRYSSWVKLMRTTSLCLRIFRRWFVTMTAAEQRSRTEEELFRAAQGEEYGALVLHLMADKNYQVDRKHQLFKVCPFLDDKRVLRVNGRLPATFPFEVRQPIILPGGSRITELLVRYLHEKFGHGNHETVLNEVRQHYFIHGLRRLLRTISRTCLECKQRSPKAEAPQMGTLPEARAAIGHKPFSFCGLDYFGPLEVIVGRRREKRWVALFTCMTTRAIHLEIASSLNMDSAIMCLRNMMARRDVQPREMRSDNGTNFKASARELAGLQRRFPAMSWIFNPPGAPHMGGCWERMVRTVKRCMDKVLGGQALTDETLRCALMEAEWIVNSHPLTHVTLDPEDEEALTPHHFLHGASMTRRPEGIRPEDDGPFLAKCWRRSQQFADHFWRRFSREVVPVLNMRTKWYEKREPLKVGDLVMVPEEGRRGRWSRGIVEGVIAAKDSDQIRQVNVRTPTGVLFRPAVKVAKCDV